MRMKNKISFCIQFLVFVLFMSACNQHKTEQTSNEKLYVNLDSIIQSDIDLNTREFKVDIVPTTFAHPGCTQYFYRSIDTKIPIKSITVNKDSLDRILNILIQKKIESFLFSSNQQIEYIPRFGYSVRSDQKTSLFSTFNVNVDVKYICK